MTTRYRGIVVEALPQHTWAAGTVRVSSPSTWHNQLIAIAPVQKNIPLMPGLKIEFFIGEIENRGAVALATSLEAPNVPSSESVAPPLPQTLSLVYGIAHRTAAHSREHAERRKKPEQGLGGTLHQYIQRVVADLAKELGFQASIEHAIEGGRIDVAIISKSVSIACEVPVTTKYHEWRNIKKCFNAGYNYVVSVSLEKDVLDIVRRNTLGKLSADEKGRVRFFFPEQLEEFLREILAQDANVIDHEAICDGRKVKVTYRSISPEETQGKHRIIANVLAQSLLSTPNANP